MVTYSEYQTHLAGYQIVDCGVRARGNYYFAAVDDYTERNGFQGDEPLEEERRQRLLVYFGEHEPGNQ